jgi:hypothetical protein
MGEDKSHRASAAQFFVAGELSRRGLVAVITLGNCPNTDVLVSDKCGRRFAHVQVKTYRPRRDKTVSVGLKAEIDYGESFFWVLAGIPDKPASADFEYYVLPSAKMSQLVAETHRKWLATPGKNGQEHRDNKVRAVAIPPHSIQFAPWSIEEYLGRWDLILARCEVGPAVPPDKQRV